MPSPQPGGFEAVIVVPDDETVGELLHTSLRGAELALDSAQGLTALQRLHLSRELATIRAQLARQTGALQRLRLAARLAEIRKILTGATAAVTSASEAAPGDQQSGEPPAQPVEAAAATEEATAAQEVAAFDPDRAAEDIAEGRAERNSTAQVYEFDPSRKPAQRRRDNAAAMALLAQIEAGELTSLTDEQRSTLARYSGTGGNLVGADGKKGSAYEYYTPKPIAEGVWGLLKEMGFAGGLTLDPCGGTGVFGATAPVNAAVDAVELNATSGRISQIINDGPGFRTTVAPFEAVAAATPDEVYDAVVSNVPFGEVNDRGGNQFKDPKYQGEPIQNYFLLRSIEKLRPGGLAAFITPPRCVSGKGGKEEDLRLRLSYMAEFMGAYRLPNSVFGTAQADTITDVVVFRKYSREAAAKIAELREQDPGVLGRANVLWQPFIGGTYFVDEGRRFILGEYIAKDPNKFRDVDRVVSDGSVSDIAKLLRKFGGSRVDWNLLETTESAAVVYRDGDTIQHAGQTLRMEDGRWVAITSASSRAGAEAMAEMLAKLSTPLGAVNAGITYPEAVRASQALVDRGDALQVPDWLRGLLAQLLRLPADARERNWGAAAVGLAIDQAFYERQAEETGFNYLEGYPELSAAMARVASDAKSPPAALSRAIKTAMKKVVTHYSKSGGYSGVWRGDVAQDVDSRDAGQRFEAARYQHGGGTFVPIEEARRVYGDGFDPLADDDWCVAPDGLGVARADDYYVGNYADFLARIDREIAAATDDTLRTKLVRQKLLAEARLQRTDVSTMSFNLFSPFVGIEEKAEFLRRFVDPRFAVAHDDGGRAVIECQIGTPANEQERNLKRLAVYLKTGNVSTATRAEDRESSPELEAKRLAGLRSLVTTSEAQFNAWVKANPIVMGRLADMANDPARIYFRQVDDESPLDIPGLNPAWKSHGYQNAWVRKMGREFAGINGDGVGLGKTSQALIATQHAHAIGVKKKTMFVVPNSVLSNWRKEAGRVYASTDDCLYVGLRENKGGDFTVDPSRYDADLTRVLENRHRKIFVTLEAFQRLRLREDTVRDYDAHLARVDKTYAESEFTKKNEKTKSLRAKVVEELTRSTGKSMAAPFFEDLGVDSLVFDEAHLLKNSRATVEFTGGKYLSLADPSARGLDAQAKAWFVRKAAPRRDGVILLSATPITNSPLEIYSMLSLAVGDERLNDLMVGIKGADQFMEVMCRMESRDEETLDGQLKPYNVFVGLGNVNVLRTALQTTTTMRTAEQVGAQIVVPDADEKAEAVALPQDVQDTLVEYKDAFRFALDTLMEKKNVGGSREAYERVAEKFGEPMRLIGHPFNLINKMAMLLADPELDQRATFYIVTPAQADLAASVVTKWNAKPPVDERPRMGPHTERRAVVGRKVVKDGENEVELLRIQARAKLAGDRIVLDSLDAAVQTAFEALADAEGLDLDVTVPPKLAAMIANFQAEEASPRGRIAGEATGRVRQLIFCDILPLHNKIKRLLGKRCGVPASSIAIITGQVNGKPDEILAVQDGFNAEGSDNRYRVVIANEKAEVGINLQKGTQAIHHLTIGWTPDSLTQRNGRGVRQGNETERVRVYHYDADGTFDCYKRALVSKKSDWIGAVVDPEGADNVDVTGGLTREQLEALIDSVGDRDAMGRIQERAAAADKLAREASTQGKQAVHLKTIQAQRDFLAKYPSARSWAADKVAAYTALRGQISLVRERLANPKATASALLRNENLLAELTAKLLGLQRLIDESVSIYKLGGYGTATTRGSAITLDDFIATVQPNRGTKLADQVRERFLHPYSHEIEVSEDAAIGNEWTSEVDMAKAMIESSRKDFGRLASQAGGYSEQVLARAEAGDATVIDGKVITVGTFFERNERLGVVRRGDFGAMLVSYLDEAGKVTSVTVSDQVMGSKVTLPGASGYDALVTRAAEIEDKIVAIGALPADKADVLYSASVPEVGRRRKLPLILKYPARGTGSYRLPAPYFPVVVPTAPPEGARVLARIAEQQAAVVKSASVTPFGGVFTCDSTVAVVQTKNTTYGPEWPAFLEFAKAHGLKLTRVDVAVAATGDPSSSPSPYMAQLVNPSRRSVQDAVIAGAASVDELMQRLKRYLAEELLPAYDIEGDAEAAAAPAELLRRVALSESLGFSRAVSRLERAAEAARQASEQSQPAQEVAPLPAEAPPPDTGDADRMVGISGNTRAWKEQIKGAAIQKGARAIWDGTAECWNVPFKAWVHLVVTYPRAEQELNVVESSGKMSYGRRRYR